MPATAAATTTMPATTTTMPAATTTMPAATRTSGSTPSGSGRRCRRWRTPSPERPTWTAEAVQRCAERYAARLDAVDAEIAALVEGVPAVNRRLVTSHGALGYFADRYGFSLTGTVLPGTSTLARASPADVESLARRIDAERVPAIFTDSFASDDDVSSLVHRLDGVVAVPLLTESLGEPGTAADSYTGLLLTDAARIVEALRGDHAAAGSV